MKRVLKWIGLGALGIAVSIGLVTAVGAILPTDHVAATRAVYPVPPSDVWEAVADVETTPDWRSDIDRVEVLSSNGRASRWRESGPQGTTTYETIESEPPRKRIVRIADPDLPYGGRWIYEIEPAEGGAEVTITEEGEVYNPFFRFMARFVFGHHGTMEGVHRDLGRRFGIHEIAVQRVR